MKALQTEADKFSLSLSLGTITVKGFVYPSQNGIFVGTFIATVSGTYTVHVKYSNLHLYGSPLNVQVFAAACDAGQSRVVLPGGVITGTAGIKFDVFVRAADIYGNLLRPIDVSQADKFIGSLTLPGGLVEFPQEKSWRNESEGLPITFFATVAGKFTAEILLNGKNISYSPFNILIVAAPASALFSSIYISDDKKTVVAGIPLVFRVTAFDMVSVSAPHEVSLTQLTFVFASTKMRELSGVMLSLLDSPARC